jgi:hypothetical protein
MPGTHGTPWLVIALRALALATWFGGGIATILATSAVFARAESRKTAGDFAGAILRRTNLLRNVAAVVFVASALLGARGASTWAGAVCVLMQLVAVPVDAATRKLRRDLGGNVDALAADDPRRSRFGALHGIAMLLLLVQIVAAGVAILLQ